MLNDAKSRFLLSDAFQQAAAGKGAKTKEEIADKMEMEETLRL